MSLVIAWVLAGMAAPTLAPATARADAGPPLPPRGVDEREHPARPLTMGPAPAMLALIVLGIAVAARRFRRGRPVA